MQDALMMLRQPSNKALKTDGRCAPAA